MRRILSLVFLVGLSASLSAEDSVSHVSPDGRFGVAFIGDRDSEDELRTHLVALPSRKKVMSLSSEWQPRMSQLIWSPDSRRFAVYYSSHRVGETEVWERRGSGFRKLDLPDLPGMREFLQRKPRYLHVRNEYERPVRWLRSGALEMENYSFGNIRYTRDPEDTETWDVTIEYSIAFDQAGRTSLRPIDPKPIIEEEAPAFLSRTEPGLMRGPGVRSGRPDVFEVGYEIVHRSPDKRFGILVADPSVVSTKARARNFIVQTSPLRVLGMLSGDYQAVGLNVVWSEDGKAAVAITSGEYGPQAAYLVELADGRLIRQTNVLAAVRRLFEPDFRASKAAHMDGSDLPFAILERGAVWKFEGDRLNIACEASSNEEGLGEHGTRVWWAKLAATWSIQEAKFIEQKVERTFTGALPNDDKMRPEDEEEEKPKALDEAAEPEAKDTELTMLRSPDGGFELHWKTVSHGLTLLPPGQPPGPVRTRFPAKVPDEEEFDTDKLDAMPLTFLSPDGQWLFVDYAARYEQLLYRRAKDALRFEPALPESFGKASAKFFLREGAPRGAKLDEAVVSFVDWSADSTRLLVSLNGSMELSGGENDDDSETSTRFDDWLCYYDLRSGEFTLTDRLRAHNRFAVGRVHGRPDDWLETAPFRAEPLDGPAPPSPAEADRRLNEIYQRLLARLTASEKEAIRVEQRAWLAKRDLDAAIAVNQSWSPFPEAVRREIIAFADQARTAELESKLPKSKP